MPYNAATERPLPGRRRIQSGIFLAFKFKDKINMSRLIFFFTHPSLGCEGTPSEYYKGQAVFDEKAARCDIRSHVTPSKHIFFQSLLILCSFT